MAKLQIFVLVVALSQAYASIVLTNYPALLPIEDVAVVDPHDFPTIPNLVTPPCVSSIRALLEAILLRLPEIEQPRPLPVDPIEPQLPTNPELPEIGLPEVEDTPVLETPCSACFEHINSLLTSAEKVLAVRRLAQTLSRRR